VTDPPPPKPRSLALDAAALAVGAAFTQGASLISTVVLARILVPAEFGGYQQLLLIYALLAPLLLGGIPAALTYFLSRARDDEERRRWTFDALVALTGLGLLFAVALAVFRHPIAELLNNPDLDEALLLYAPYTLFAFVAAVMPNSLIPTGQAGRAAALTAVFAGIFLACVVAGGILFRDVEGLALSASVSGGITAAVSLVVVHRRVGVQPDWSQLLSGVRKFLAYGIPLALTGVAGILGYQFDRVVVSARFTPSDYAIYAVGAVELPLTLVVQQSINSVLLPALAVRHRDADLAGLSALWREAIRKTSLILLPFFAIAMLTADELVRVLFGERYEESADILRIYLLLMPMRVATYGLIPMAIGRTDVNLIAALVVLFANAVLALALVGPLGLEGPALATVLATGLTVVYYLVRLRGLLSLSVGELFPWRVVGVNLVFSVLALIPAAPVLLLDLPDIALLAMATVVYATCYVAIMRRTGRITEDDFKRLRATVSRLRPGQRALRSR
jgi:O-antigen/teichoic acid export membrane protein